MISSRVLEYMKSLYESLDTPNLHIPENERILRKSRICDAAKEIETGDYFHCTDRFFQLAHEIESLHFLSTFGEIHMSQDSQHEKGADFILNGNLSIECVCASLGTKLEETGLSQYLVHNKVVDYNEKKRLLSARLTSSLHGKVQFYEERCGKSISKDYPYIIFLSLGRLSWEWFAEEYGMALTDILFGRGKPSITINPFTGTIDASGYTHVFTFKKFNGVEINSNLFLDPSFSCVSGILLATEVFSQYTTENTFLFVNPFSTLKLNPLIFPGIIYWDILGQDKYAPYKDGMVLL